MKEFRSTAAVSLAVRRVASLVCAAGLVLSATQIGVAQDTALPPSDTSATLRIWHYHGDPPPPWWPIGVARFQEEFPNVAVESTPVPYANMTAKLLGSGISGDMPDGFHYNPADAEKLYAAGVLKPMTPYWSAYEDKDQFPSSVVWKSGEEVLSVQGYINTTAIWYNKTILDEAGVEVPTTMEEFSDALAAVDEAGYDGFLLSAQPHGSGEFDFLPWLYAYGQNYGAWDREVVKDVLDMFGGWIDAGYIPRDITNNNENDNGNIFAIGNYAFAQNGNWNLNKARDADYPFEWGIANFPAGPAGAHGIGGGEGFSIGGKTEHAALVFRLFEVMLLTKDSQLGILKDTGSLPVRADAATDPFILDDPALSTYATVVAQLGARPPTPKVSDLLNELGRIWNAFVGGSIDSSQAADLFVENLSDL